MFNFNSNIFTVSSTPKYPNEQTRFVGEKLLADQSIKSVLNIGYRYDSDQTIRNLLLANNKTFSVLEGYKPNCEMLWSKDISKDIHNMDVRNIETLSKSYDATIWLHGPEHILWEEFVELRHKIETKANKLVIYQAPIGECPQEEIYNNPFERHVATLNADMFAGLGYKTVNHDKNGEWTFSAFLEKQ
jgi:hypothetical protein